MKLIAAGNTNPATQGDPLSVDLFAILATVVGSALAAAIAIIAVMVSGLRGLRSDVANVRDRVARMEGMMATLQDILLRRNDRDVA